MYRSRDSVMQWSAASAALPSDLAPARISQVAVEFSGRVHVLRRGEPPVIVFEADGTFVRSYGENEILRFAWRFNR